MISREQSEVVANVARKSEAPSSVVALTRRAASGLTASRATATSNHPGAAQRSPTVVAGCWASLSGSKAIVRGLAHSHSRCPKGCVTAIHGTVSTAVCSAMGRCPPQQFHACARPCFGKCMEFSIASTVCRRRRVSSGVVFVCARVSLPHYPPNRVATPRPPRKGIHVSKKHVCSSVGL